MQEIHQIVVPVDFSGITEQLVEYACYVAKKFSATVDFVYVAELNQGHDMLLGSSVFGDMEEKIIRSAEGKMENLLEDNAGQCKGATGEVVKGEVVDAIIDHVKSKNADLLIVSTHGTKGLEKILLGSVTERVIKRAPCPVLSFNPHR